MELRLRVDAVEVRLRLSPRWLGNMLLGLGVGNCKSIRVMCDRCELGWSAVSSAIVEVRGCALVASRWPVSAESLMRRRLWIGYAVGSLARV